jgi:hypothetical protein
LNLLVWLAAFFLADCAALKPAARTANDLAGQWCAAHYAQLNGLSVDEALQKFCATELQLRPWLDLILAGEKQGVGKLGVQKECK